MRKRRREREAGQGEGLGIHSDDTRKPLKCFKWIFKQPFWFPAEKSWRGAKGERRDSVSERSAPAGRGRRDPGMGPAVAQTTGLFRK